MECQNGEVSFIQNPLICDAKTLNTISKLTLGTGYYYLWFCPGLGSVVIFLVLLTYTVQHGAHVNCQ